MTTISVMRTGQLAQLLGVSASTIQNWLREFDTFFDKRYGSQKVFNDQEVIVAATINKLSSEGLGYQEIKAKLQSGYRVDSPSEAAFGVDTRMVPAAAMEQIIDASELRIKLDNLQHDYDHLIKMLADANEENKALRQRVDELHDKIIDLNRALGKAEGELEFRRSLDRKD